MSNRKALASIVGAALLATCGIAKAETKSDGLQLNRPLMLDDAAPAMPLTALINKTGAGSWMSDNALSVGGYVEASWTVSDSAPPANTITGRYFDFENQDLTLNQIDVYLNRAVDTSKNKFDVGGRIEMIYGGDSRLIHSLGLFDYQGIYNVPAGNSRGPDEQFDLNQAYVDVYVPFNNTGVKIRAGKFNTLLGYETINPVWNNSLGVGSLYSHSFLFGFAIPLTNTGVIGTYVINPEWTVTAGLTRGWDTSTEDDNDTIDAIGQVAWSINSKSALTVNFEIGPDQPGDNSNYRDVLDVIYVQKLADQLAFAINADYGYQFNSSTSGSDCQWFGAAGYLTYTVSNMVAATARAEYFNDDDGYRGIGSSVYEVTLGVAITPMPNDSIGKNLVIRPEVRYDYANDKVYDGGTGRSQGTFGVDAIFAF